MDVLVNEGLHAGHSAPGGEAHVEKGMVVHHPQQTKQHPLLVLGHWGIVSAAGMRCGRVSLVSIGRWAVRKDVVRYAQRRVLHVAGHEGLELASTKDCMHLVGFCPVPESKQGAMACYLNNKTGEICVSLTLTLMFSLA